MGRKKQRRPHRSVGIVECPDTDLNKPNDQNENGGTAVIDEPFFVEVERNCWVSSEHYDISEVLLTNLSISPEFHGFNLSDDFFQDSSYAFRFRMCDVSKLISRIKLGHWPIVSASSVCLELVHMRVSEDKETPVVMVSGSFDGPDEGVSGLAHLASLKSLTLRPILGATLLDSLSSVRVRVEILKSAFDECESLLDNRKQLWKKSMMSVMAWLRPEVTTSEARYGCSISTDIEIDSPMETNEASSAPRKRAGFDVAGFYEAVKPSKEDPMLENDMPDLLPKLRPYQLRAAYWMVQREKGASGCLSGSEKSQFIYPLCTPVEFIDTCSRMFYNPFSGNISLRPENSTPYVFGGILADEMGLGKTVELLACIFAHRMPATEIGNISFDEMQVAACHKINIKRLKRERVECECGAVSESSRYKGLWVQCDVCDAWQHADCVGYSAKGKTLKSGDVPEAQGCGKNQTGNSRKHVKSKNSVEIVEMDGLHICRLCSELIQAAGSPVATGATLIVCPAPILPQWHAEIIRHTNRDSLKTCIYDGVKNGSLSDTSVMDIGELLSADIVLTTYDVLKEDISHDSDRHEGDRRFMRFQKRYPVIPTFLTRIFWWRICLDEAQMVESNAAAATEMALRLHAKHRWCITGTPIQRKLDDLYGLLRFLKASPFDALRWWVEVIRDPYERGDARAMVFTHNFFKELMWRSSKVHVAEELQIPPQEECLSWLSLSPIEEHFYQRQHETCVGYAREVIESFRDDGLKKVAGGSKLSDTFITHVEAAKLLNSLLKLRQACCHPQVGSSGLRSLQQSPMTMEEILLVLVGKTKVEGEEELRKIVCALNGLAGIAVIKQDFTQAVALYKEAFELAEENSEDFGLDPLLNIHIHHNLADILSLTSDSSQQYQFDGQLLGRPKDQVSKMFNAEECDQHVAKRLKLSSEASYLANGLSDEKICETKPNLLTASSDELRLACENLKQRFLSAVNSKLALAQLDFRKSYEQVNNALGDVKNQYATWWLDVLHLIEQNKETSTELIRKIGEAVTRTMTTSRTSKIASCFQSITALKYYIQTGLDSLEDSRKTLLDKVLEIDQTMGNPREEDIEGMSYCPNCQANGDGQLCVLCQHDKMFQVYEARLFRLNKRDDGKITSVEEALDLQKKESARNHFYQTLSQHEKNLSKVKFEDDGKKRDVGKVQASKSPSDVEVVLGIIKSYSKTLLGREVMSAAKKHLLLLEGMRKEYVHARTLANFQAQVLRAHDEIKMATSRLRLRENENDTSIQAISPGELDAASAVNSADKFLALSSLSRIKGQLRYLKGLVQSKKSSDSESTETSSISQVSEISPTPSKEAENGCLVKADEATCPICQEKLSSQKMVFQCGHLICCKCLFAMTERKVAHHGRGHDKWVICPTCRQHTDFGDIAFVDDGQNKSCNSSFQGCEGSEASIKVQGSYSTKIEAVTRRILWITSRNPKGKVLVFSSWNDVLDVLEHALTANSISHIRMKGGRKSHVAISHFKGERCSTTGQSETKSIQVLLLLIQHGANGLNLLEAQHVILVEPLLNPAAEAQAISRVHRIGQENKTVVHRFVVKETVEESIYKLNKSRSTSSLISGNKKNKDQPLLTLKDVESLFRVAPSTVPESGENPTGSLMHLPPSVAAAIAAERRLTERPT